MISPPINAQVRIEGQVTDPSGTSVGGAEVTFVFHETDGCSTPQMARTTVTTRSDGRYDVLAPGLEVTSDFEPRDVCLEVQAEPPANRPDLAPSEVRERIVTLRTQRGDEPLDRVEVDLTLPSADGA